MRWFIDVCLEYLNGGFLYVQVNSCIGVKRSFDGTMHLYINGVDIGIAATNIPKVSRCNSKLDTSQYECHGVWSVNFSVWESDSKTNNL